MTEAELHATSTPTPTLASTSALPSASPASSSGSGHSAIDDNTSINIRAARVLAAALRELQQGLASHTTTASALSSAHTHTSAVRRALAEQYRMDEARVCRHWLERLAWCEKESERVRDSKSERERVVAVFGSL